MPVVVSSRPISLDCVSFVDEHDAETSLFRGLVYQLNVGKDKLGAALLNVFLGHRNSKLGIGVHGHPDSKIRIEMEVWRKFVGQMCHETLGCESSETSAHEIDGVSVSGFQGGVEGFVSIQTIGIEMLAVPGNAVFVDYVDSVFVEIGCVLGLVSH